MSNEIQSPYTADDVLDLIAREIEGRRKAREILINEKFDPSTLSTLDCQIETLEGLLEWLRQIVDEPLVNPSASGAIVVPREVEDEIYKGEAAYAFY